jgi:hypothetical protein
MCALYKVRPGGQEYGDLEVSHYIDSDRTD